MDVKGQKEVPRGGDGPFVCGVVLSVQRWRRLTNENWDRPWARAVVCTAGEETARWKPHSLFCGAGIGEGVAIETQNDMTTICPANDVQQRPFLLQF